MYILLKKNLTMIINKYFHHLKKTGPPVETGRPLRLLDMRVFNFLVVLKRQLTMGEPI